MKLNNKGSALVSVLVITMFITILATTMLYMVTTNYKEKQTDYQNKQSFYGAEKALDEFKSLLVQDVQDAYAAAYGETAKNFLWKASDRTGYFQETFMNELNKIWEKRLADVTAEDLALVPNVVDTMDPPQKVLLAAIQKLMRDKAASSETTPAGAAEYTASAKCFYKVDSYGVYDDSGSKKFAIKGIQVKCTVGDYTTFLYTDICLEPPGLNWVDSSSDNNTGSAVKIETIAFTDYVYYINWHKADYDERDNYNTNIGTGP